ncbi:resolvase [Gilliamella sp. Occ3-1]|jgi:DNA invertase Pin-like site-specific DNA recombinase|uniref:recombinase family protein n=1 Tax=Gilliamella sp. Occ3-1 TaxID=3120253 RepID=UPI00080E31D3|nr:recombinase family protein [Gilliamella apicola]OCG69497.1 resolvase [Gilliamella apicola]
MKTARIYLRVSTREQELERQERIIDDAKKAGYYIANVYKEKASGARFDRPELQRMISELQDGDVIIAEKIDRLTRLPLDEAINLIDSIKSKGARLCVPDILDLSEISSDATGVTKIVIDSMQDLLLKIALQVARDDYEIRRQRQREGVAIAKAKGKYKGRQANKQLHKLIIECRSSGKSINKTAELLNCSPATVKNVWSRHKNNK